jgi:hypothetical protein
MQTGVPVRFYAEPLGLRYADGLERVELYLLSEYETLISKPPTGHRKPIQLVTKSGSYRAGFRTNPPSCPAYICPDLRDENGRQTKLARLLKDCGIPMHGQVEVMVSEDVFTFVQEDSSS